MNVHVKSGDPARKGDWMQTFSGREVYPLDMRPWDVDIYDIGAALSKQCRYGGHCLRFYSVAEHCVHVANRAPRDMRLTALLHDASEGYLVDLPRPVKPYLMGYAPAEEHLMQVISAKFGTEWPLPDEVKRLDSAILDDERMQNMSTPPREWNPHGGPLGVRLEFWTPDRAYAEFMGAFFLFGGKV